MKKLILGSLVGSVVLVAAAAFGISLYLERLIERSVKSITGVVIKVSDVRINWLSAKVRVVDLKIFNPPGFPDDPFVTIPEIEIAIDPRSVFHRTVRFKEVRLNLSEATLLKNSENRVNAVVLSERLAADRPGRPAPAEASSGKSIFIDRLVLSIGTIRYRDIGRGGKEISLNVNLKDREYRNIEDLKTVVKAVAREIVQQAMKETFLNHLLAPSAYLLTGAMPAAVLLQSEQGKKIAEKAGDLLKNAGRGLKKAGERMTNLLKKPADR